MSSEPELELRTLHDNVIAGVVVRSLQISYRPAGSAHWTAFIVLPAEGQTVEQLERYAEAMARLHFEHAGV